MDKVYSVQITMGNAAFGDNPGDELARILRELADKVEQFSFTHDRTYYPVRDVNGNTVGRHGYENETQPGRFE